MIFFQQNSFHIMVLVRCTSHMLNQSSLVNGILLSFTHLSHIYSLEVPLFFSRAWYSVETTLPVLFLYALLSAIVILFSSWGRSGFISFSKKSLTWKYLMIPYCAYRRNSLLCPVFETTIHCPGFKCRFTSQPAQNFDFPL